MNFLATEKSQLTALFYVTRHAGQLFLPSAVLKLNERYMFSGYPQSLDDLTGDIVKFKHGVFEDTAIDSFEIYGDGIVISSSSPTDFIDRFFYDICEWMEDDLGLTMIKTRSVDRLYESNLLIESEKDILKPLETMSKIADLIQVNLKEISNIDVEYQPYGFSFAPDLAKIPNPKPSRFSVERKLESEYSMNQYFTSAPLKTKQHMAILNELESLV